MDGYDEFVDKYGKAEPVYINNHKAGRIFITTTEGESRRQRDRCTEEDPILTQFSRSSTQTDLVNDITISSAAF